MIINFKDVIMNLKIKKKLEYKDFKKLNKLCEWEYRGFCMEG